MKVSKCKKAVLHTPTIAPSLGQKVTSDHKKSLKEKVQNAAKCSEKKGQQKDDLGTTGGGDWKMLLGSKFQTTNLRNSISWRWSKKGNKRQKGHRQSF